MLVCLCKVVNDTTVRAAVRAGAETTDEVGAVCGAGTGCGGCKTHIEEIIESECAGCPRRAEPNWVPCAAHG